MFHLSREDIRCLSPPEEIKVLRHSADYIKSGATSSAKRHIFNTVELDGYEIEALEHFKRELSSAGVDIDSSCSERDLLRYLYSTRFNIKKAISAVQESIKWRKEVNKCSTILPAVEVLNSGVIYLCGRDKQLRPILVIDLDKYDWEKLDKKEIEFILTLYFDALRQYAFVPGKIENIVVIIDASDSHFNGMYYEKIDLILKRIEVSHPCTVEKVYVLNPADAFNASWSAVRGLFENESSANVIFLPCGQFHKVQEDISENQLELKHGGSLSDLTVFWPISAVAKQNQRYSTYTKSITPSIPVRMPPKADGDNYDFKYEDLLQLIAEEHQTIFSPRTSVTKKQTEEDLNVKKLLTKVESSVRYSQGINMANSEVFRETRHTEILPKIDPLATFETNPGRATVETVKRSSPSKNRGQEEWMKRHSTRPIENKPKKAEKDTRMGFCGLFVVD